MKFSKKFFKANTHKHAFHKHHHVIMKNGLQMFKIGWVRGTHEHSYKMNGHSCPKMQKFSKTMIL